MEIHPNSLNFFSVRLAQLDPERSLLRVCSGSSTSKGIIPRILYQTQRGTFLGSYRNHFSSLSNYQKLFWFFSYRFYSAYFYNLLWMFLDDYPKLFKGIWHLCNSSDIWLDFSPQIAKSFNIELFKSEHVKIILKWLWHTDYTMNWQLIIKYRQCINDITFCVSVSESRGEVNILLSTEIALVDSSGHS